MRWSNALLSALLGAIVVTSLGLGWLFWPPRPAHAVGVTPDGACVLLDVARHGRFVRWPGAGAWATAHPEVVFPEACDVSTAPCPAGFVCTPATQEQCVPSPIPGPALWKACADAVDADGHHFGAHEGWANDDTDNGVMALFARARSAGDGAAPVTAWRRGRGAGQSFRSEVTTDGTIRGLVEFQADVPFFMMLLGLPLFGCAFIALLVLGLVRGRRSSGEPDR